MMIDVLYFDDEISRPGRDAQKVKELLTIDGEFECRLMLPPKVFEDLPSQPPDALLVDLELGTAPPNGKPISYYGSTLAAEMRMRHPACPIILVTRRQVIAERESFLERSINVDLIIYKDDVLQNPDQVREKVTALADGFRRLQTVAGKEWSSVLDLMGANQDEKSLLREAAPPLDEKRWTVPEVARWIRNVVMRYPGILYDTLTVATRLGVTVEAFNTSMIRDLIEPAQYTGVFNNGDRWWRDRVFGKAQELMTDHDLQGPVFQDFVKAYKEKFGDDLDQPICIFDGTPIADWVCYIYQQPVKQRNSIPYYPDSRPSVMDQARVSFKAILDSDSFDESLVDKDSYDVVKSLWD